MKESPRDPAALQHPLTAATSAIGPTQRAALSELVAQLRKNTMKRGALLLRGNRMATVSAAGTIARELSLHPFEVDLTAVVSEYVGETEKNLERLFAEAEGKDWLLFFDEADALFGDRTEVKDSHDRYANIEVNYLLQRIEAFDGLTVLTTNLRKKLDDAFRRRFRYIVDLPDAR